jgi:phage shock protein C
MAVYCQSCGNALHGNARFCTGCGAAVPMAASIPSRPLLRPHVGRQIGGVCLALAQAYGWDVALIRIFSVLGFLFSGGLVGVAYLAAWIGIPEEPVPYPVPLPGTYPGPYQGPNIGPNSGSNPGAYPPQI